MDRIDKNLEFIMYILLGIMGGLATLIVIGIFAYAINYRRLIRLIIGLIIGRIINSVSYAFAFVNSSLEIYDIFIIIISIMAIGMAYKIHKDRSKYEQNKG